MRYAGRHAVAKGIRFLALMLALSGASAAAAEDFPAKPVRIIVPYGAGTGVDITARILAPQLSSRLKQAVIVENRDGAGATIGVNALKRATPDGYTIGIIVSANTAQPWLMKSMPFDVRTDFMPIAMIYTAPLVMVVPQAFPATSLAEFIAYAKANPGKLFFGSIGAGTTTHLAAELLKQVAGIDLVHVPFKGSAEMHNAVAAGNLQLAFDNYISPKPLVDAGRLRVLATTSLRRMAVLPQVPAIAEAYPGFELALWTGFAAPLGTPQQAFDRLALEIRGALQSAEFGKRLTQIGSESNLMPAAEFSQRIAADYENFGRIIRAAGIKPE
jgi:tripartite-type tricarboxylate transporter receptor subunit TctC